MASFLLFYLYNFHVYMIAKTTVLINYIYTCTRQFHHFHCVHKILQSIRPNNFKVKINQPSLEIH